MIERSDEDIEKTVKRVLDATTQNEDPELAEKFASMRTAALKQMPEAREEKRKSFYFAQIGVVSAAIVFVFSLVFFLPTDVQTVESYASINDLELLTEADDLEMFAQEDVEFYLWLESEIEG